MRVEALLDYAEQQIRDISRSYTAQLEAEHVPLELCIKIKNCCENLRSVLDYLAHDIFEHTYPGEPIPAKLDFPLQWSRPAEAKESEILKCFPKLRSVNRDLWQALEQFQPYKRQNKWLRRFVLVVNDHKHWDLVAQTKRQAPVGSPGGDRLGPVVYRLNDTWIEYRFRGIDANAFFLLEEAHTNIRSLVDEISDLL